MPEQVNITVQLKLELVYFEATVQHLSHYIVSHENNSHLYFNQWNIERIKGLKND